MNRLKIITGTASILIMLVYAVMAWEPPIGIPRPAFGIEETYRKYDDPASRNPVLDYTQNSEGGYYTHYVDNTDSNAVNTDNPYGTPSQPRLNFPRFLPAGSVVEIHNGSNSNGWGAAQIGGEGTAQMPIFVRGINMPRLDFPGEIGYYDNARYIIVEGISFFKGGIFGRQEGTIFDTTYIAVRNCDFHGDENGGGFGNGQNQLMI